MSRHWKAILLILITVSCTSDKNGSVIFPEARAWVNDYENVLKEEDEAKLNEFLAGYEQYSSREIVVVTIDSIKPYEDIHKYAVDLGGYLGVGKEELDNGLVIVLCTKERSVGIATGLGTARSLTDQICQETIDSVMAPYFRDEQYSLGLTLGIRHLTSNWIFKYPEN